MCFERTDMKVKPFHVGYKVMQRVSEKYYSAFSLRPMIGGYVGVKHEIPTQQWIDEMPWRHENLLLEQDPQVDIGWHVFTHQSQTKKFIYDHFPSNHTIVRVECYGLDKPYGLGLAYGKPAGRFQFMKILEEIK